IEAAWTVERQASLELPEFTHEWFLAERYPVRVLHLSVTTPGEGSWHTFAPHRSDGGAGPLVPADPHTTTWTFSDLPAFEPRAGDFPARRTAPWVGVSSLRSWDAFAAWYRRLSAGSEETGPAVAAL